VLEKTRKFSTLAIIFLELQTTFLVLEGFPICESISLLIPAQGRYQVTHQELDEAYTGVVLTFLTLCALLKSRCSWMHYWQGRDC
jgi:ABC-type bacteriocin/lantibiotic exporter with double-glycine peptidase domain